MPPELVICGPAGTGKTYPVWAVIHDLCKSYPLRVLALRATRASLTESVLVTYEEEVLARDGWSHIADGAGRAHRTSYVYPHSGATIVPAGLDRNPSRILSTAWDVISINETIEVKEEIWETLGSRIGRPRPPRYGVRGDLMPTFGWLWGDTNPGAPDHWLKKRCERGTATLWNTTHKANPAMWDGKGWTLAGLSYLDTLNRLTGIRRKRLLEGLWVQGEGVWFDTFDPSVHVTEKAEYDAKYKTVLAIDTGLRTGAVWFQLREAWDGSTQVYVFADYFADGAERDIKAYGKALEILSTTGGRRIDRIVHDPAGTHREDAGPSSIGEFLRAGIQRLEPWPLFSVRNGLDLVESFVGGTTETPPAALFVHPRCTNLVNAFAGYQRKRMNGVWMDEPQDPQHPYEDLMDALRGGLVACFPDGRRPQPKMSRVQARSVF